MLTCDTDLSKDLDINNFKLSLQAAVNAIRGAGARTQYILVPGGNWTPASGFITQNKAALKTITDPVGGTDLLVYDLHQCKFSGLCCWLFRC